MYLNKETIMSINELPPINVWPREEVITSGGEIVKYSREDPTLGRELLSCLKMRGNCGSCDPKKGCVHASKVLPIVQAQLKRKALADKIKRDTSS